MTRKNKESGNNNRQGAALNPAWGFQPSLNTSLAQAVAAAAASARESLGRLHGGAGAVQASQHHEGRKKKQVFLMDAAQKQYISWAPGRAARCQEQTGEARSDTISWCSGIQECGDHDCAAAECWAQCNAWGEMWLRICLIYNCLH